MVRERKYRAWGGEKKKYFVYFTLDGIDEDKFTESEVSGDGGYLCLFKDEVDDVQDFTGLHDKNGKEIYEGDIFPCLYAYDGCTSHVMVVEWSDDRAAFFPRWDYAKCDQKGVSKTMHDLTRLEIIGNVYESPKLLSA